MTPQQNTQATTKNPIETTAFQKGDTMFPGKDDFAWEKFSRLWPKEAEQIVKARRENSHWFLTPKGKEIYRHWEAYRMGYNQGWSNSEAESAIKELKEDFKRIYIMHFGKDGWNAAIDTGSLPKWLAYTKNDREPLGGN